MRSLGVFAFVAGVVGLGLACGSTSSSDPAGDPGASSGGASSGGASSGGTSSSSSSSSGSSSSGASTSSSSSSGGGADAGVDAAAAIATASCSATPPAGAALAPALPTYAGTCPTLAAAPSATTITSSGASREVIVVKPSVIAPGEKLPVIFFWHWLGGSPKDVLDIVDVQNAAELRRFVAIVPAPKGDVLFRWPFEASQSDARVEEEAKLFDDTLACVAASLPVNKECVASAGVSAGALWTAQLAVARSGRLSSIVSLSGGVDGVVRPWQSVPHHMPALVLWGGPTDMYPSNLPIMKFEKASKALEDGLVKDDHFLLECVHNCGHAVPPLDPPAAGGHKWDIVWKFVLDHPYWLPSGKSPYQGKPLATAYPSWCGLGKDGATPRPAGSACP